MEKKIGIFAGPVKWMGTHWNTLKSRYGLAMLGVAMGLFISTPYAVLTMQAIEVGQWPTAAIWFGVTVLMPTMGGGLLSRLDRRSREIDAERRSQGGDG